MDHKGTLDFEIRFFEGIVKERPDFVDALAALAEVYTRKGLYQKGLELDQRLASLCPEDPVVYYNLGCSYALMNQRADAIEALKRALALGYDDLEHMAEDKDLETLREDPWFQRVIKP